ncbi:PREDICTED: platelet-derived growth factor receptor alpha-like isoform X2 [Acropora digitifera]|uniref:platelet-derived growth factor receptor alpha-like isoform X2 n=1 Tax=Acropora digitifera TaxID=70779 RepID=UPI00077A07F8|nr:PREDICTED: platelet-derived growth factor receptor alpha-like isoform X2 [Acropora digitifera]
MDELYKNMPVYDKTEVLKLRSGSVIVYFILYFKSAVTPKRGLEILNFSISTTGYYGKYKASSLSFPPEASPTASTPTSCVCPCPKNEIVTILLVIIVVLVLIIIGLIAVIVWQRRKLGISRVRRPYEVPEDKGAGFYGNEFARTKVLSGNSTQQGGSPDEQAYMPLKEITQSKTEKTSPNVEYAPLDVRTRSWEVARDDVDVDKIIGKGAFGQVAKGTVRNLPNGSAPTRVAIKMLKANAPESDKCDLKSELELMKTLKPHPHVIKLLGCVTESEPLLVLIEYVPFGDLLGYLRKSRGLNDTYYKDPDIKPNTNLTSEQLMKFAWQIADGMSYLSMRKIIHRDLAARNVLVGERETCKVTDFGMARDVQQENVYERKSKSSGQHSKLCCMDNIPPKVTCGSPYPRMDGKKIANSLQEGYRMPKPMHVDNELYEIMMNCWKNEPQDRPSFTSLTNQLKRIENQHKRLINMHIYDNDLYATLDDLHA